MSRNNQKKTIFNASEVASRFTAGHEAAKTAGKEDTAWWRASGILNIEWAAARSGNNNTQWISVTYTDKAGVSGPLNVRINKEVHCGMIKPNSEEEAAKMTALLKNKKEAIVPRTGKPTLQIQQFKVPVKTADADGIVVATDAEGKPILPADETRSDYYKVAHYVNLAFTFEARERIDRGMALIMKTMAMKKDNKNVTPQQVLEAFAAEQGPRVGGDMILSVNAQKVNDQLRGQFPAAVSIDAMLKTALLAVNAKTASLVQTHISMEAKKNKGLPLPNPMTRINMEFDQTTGVSKVSFFDKSKPYKDETGKLKFETAKVEGVPVNADNIHHFIRSGSAIDGIVSLDGVCFSSLGISIPVKAEVIIADKASVQSVDQDDVYGGEYAPDVTGDIPVKKAETPPNSAPSTPAKSAAAPAANGSSSSSATVPVSTPTPAADDIDFASMLGELSQTSASPAK